MTDERYVFIQDVREKKTTARSSHNRRTHAGKGGAVKFPSDYLSKKELKAMNGEIHAYRMNSPLTWQEFKALPYDLKIAYIKAIREKYGAPNIEIAEMFGCSAWTVSMETKRLGISTRDCKPKRFDRLEWDAFLHGGNAAHITEAEEEVVSSPDAEEVKEQDTAAQVEDRAVPYSGNMYFYGTAENALKTIVSVLGDKKFKIYIAWKECEGREENG